MAYKRLLKEKKISTQFVQAALYILSAAQEIPVSERDRTIVRRVMEGETYQAIGKSCGLSSQRVYEIARRMICSMYKMPKDVFKENARLQKCNEALEQELRLVRYARSKFAKGKEPSSSSVDSVPLRDCEMSTRLRNILDVHFPGVKDVWALSHLTKAHLESIPHLGRKTLLEINLLLGKFSLHLSED